ncbi:MAG: nitrile hydratase accessory protein [Pseudomonadota bacterium]
MNASETDRALLDALPDLPRGDGGPVFSEPWEAQAFAMTLALHQAGKFTWPEWAEALSAELKAAGTDQDGHDYYRHWLRALERLSADKGLTSEPELTKRRKAWDRAARATRHGEPIVLGAKEP